MHLSYCFIFYVVDILYSLAELHLYVLLINIHQELFTVYMYLYCTSTCRYNEHVHMHMHIDVKLVYHLQVVNLSTAV